MKKLNPILNLTTIHKILSNYTVLNFRKYGEAQVVTQELLDRYKQGDTDAADIIAQEILKNIHGAMKHFGIMEGAPPQEWQDFRDKTALRIWEYSVPRYDPSQTQFNTFVFNMVGNMWKNWLKQKSTTPLDTGLSLDEPVGEEGSIGIDVKDPFALGFKSEVEAQIIESALLENIRNPRHREILELWLTEDPGENVKTKAVNVAKKYNMVHPEKPIEAERMYRLIIYEIYPLVLDVLPEAASSVGYMKNPEMGPGDVKWIRKPKPEEITSPNAIISEEKEESYIPLEERIAPVYRIDPQTGERILISLNMKRRIISTQETWCYNVLTFLSIERYGKFKRTIKSSTTR